MKTLLLFCENIYWNTSLKISFIVYRLTEKFIKKKIWLLYWEFFISATSSNMNKVVVVFEYIEAHYIK